MALLLYVYSRSSIQAAKLNAQRHREADGGQFSWRNEAMRHHGMMDKLSESGSGKQLLSRAVGTDGEKSVRGEEIARRRKADEERIKEMMKRAKGEE